MKFRELSLVIIILLIPLTAWGKSGWQFVSPMTHGRYGHDATLGTDGKIYVMGGMVFAVSKKRMLSKYNDGRYSTLVYDPKKDTWKYLTPVPGWRYLSGDFIIYDQNKKSWEWVAYKHGMKIPEDARRTDLERQGNGVAIVIGKDGKIHWFGGMGQFEWIGKGEDIVLTYDPLNDAWTEVTGKYIKYTWGDTVKPIYHTDIPRMLERRIDHRALITSDGKMYVIGGYRIERIPDPHDRRTGTTLVSVRTNTMECYDPKKGKWEYKRPLRQKELVQFAAAVGPDDKIYVFGGAAGMATNPSTPVVDSVEVYDPKTDTWSSRKPMPVSREGHDAVLVADEKIYIVGGLSRVHGPPLKDVFIYDPEKDTWEKGPDLNIPRANPAAVATPDGKIYVIGGTDVRAYGARDTINSFLPQAFELYRGKVQETVEVLDISK